MRTLSKQPGVDTKRVPAPRPRQHCPLHVLSLFYVLKNVSISIKVFKLAEPGSVPFTFFTALKNKWATLEAVFLHQLLKGPMLMNPRKPSLMENGRQLLGGFFGLKQGRLHRKPFALPVPVMLPVLVLCIGRRQKCSLVLPASQEACSSEAAFLSALKMVLCSVELSNNHTHIRGISGGSRIWAAGFERLSRGAKEKHSQRKRRKDH